MGDPIPGARRPVTRTWCLAPLRAALVRSCSSSPACRPPLTTAGPARGVGGAIVDSPRSRVISVRPLGRRSPSRASRLLEAPGTASRPVPTGLYRSRSRGHARAPRRGESHLGLGLLTCVDGLVLAERPHRLSLHGWWHGPDHPAVHGLVVAASSSPHLGDAGSFAVLAAPALRARVSPSWPVWSPRVVAGRDGRRAESLARALGPAHAGVAATRARSLLREAIRGAAVAVVCAWPSPPWAPAVARALD